MSAKWGKSASSVALAPDNQMGCTWSIQNYTHCKCGKQLSYVGIIWDIQDTIYAAIADKSDHIFFLHSGCSLCNHGDFASQVIHINLSI